MGTLMSDDYKINVDADRPATLNNGAGVLTDCATLRDAVMAWRWLPLEQKMLATVKLIGGRVYSAQEIERLHYGPNRSRPAKSRFAWQRSIRRKGRPTPIVGWRLVVREDGWSSNFNSGGQAGDWSALASGAFGGADRAGRMTGIGAQSAPPSDANIQFQDSPNGGLGTEMVRNHEPFKHLRTRHAVRAEAPAIVDQMASASAGEHQQDVW